MIKLLQIFLEVLLGGFIIIGAYSQLLRPLVKGTQMFPMFRHRSNLERDIEGVNESLDEKDQRRILDRKKRELGTGNSN